MRKHQLATAIETSIRADGGDGAQRCSFLRVNARADGVAEVMIYGAIGESLWMDTVSARDLADQIAAINASVIHVRFNSEGGVVTDGIAIYNALRAHTARKVGFVDGQAASIAGVILMACDEVVMYPTSLFMLHAPSTIAAGTSSDFREFADTLDTHARAMAEAYAAKTGKPDEIAELLASGRDHWYTGREAVDFGFADRVEEFATNASATAGLADGARVVALNTSLAAFRNAPAPITACLRGHITTALSPTVFASLSEVSQQAVIGHIEDPSMKDRYLRIVAEAGAPAAGTPAAAAPVAAAPVTAAAPAAVDPQAAATAAITALRTRNTEIRAMAQPHMGNAQVADYINGVIDNADPAVTADVAGRQVLALLAQGSVPIAGNITAVAGGDERDGRRRAMLNAIEARAGVEAATGDNPFRGHTMAEIARECVTASGVNTRGMDRMQIVGTAFTHSTSDFPGLLGEASRRAVLRGYEEAEEQVDQFTRAVSVPDFKPTNLVGLGAFSDLLVVPEGSEFKYGTFSEQSQAMKIVTYGRLFSITRQAIINDDLGIFSEVPRKLGQAARRTIAKAVFDLINSNPVLPDGFRLFSAEHGNLLDGSAISTLSVDAMRAKMATQKDKDGNRIRVPLKTLLTPIALGGLARTVRTSQYEVSGAKNLTTPNIVQNTFDVIDDARFDDASAAAWYGVANSAFVDSIVIGYLDGNQTPFLDQEEGFTVDGVAWKVRLDAAPAIADYRGIFKNPGV
ncbi:ClpP-like prohead protease/major capsid protein fusion protein [Luteimonas fraxinea]|uniref:ATP-dependent Clp protease proteolytic subunit n=1 Tax=Luteimonas fraxinea TaxID=2901869 RepID=A0ABS8UEF6_9GAMM|nr:ClpP-like prohead protease/major capsid protein fusion protein [Luteimonas fraxinea]MCD9097053.1 Clp protease ClpP [Luteimonas fraxinea]